MPGSGRGRSIEFVRIFDKIGPRSLAFDALLAAGLLTAGLIGQIELTNELNETFTREADAFHFLLIILMTLPLALRRVYPTPVFIAILGAWVIDRGLDYPDTPATIAVGVVFYTIGAELSRKGSFRVGGISALVIIGWTTVGLITLESVSTANLVTTIIFTLTLLLLGREVHERRRRIQELTVRAERAERDREEKARRAVADERARIARELHDVVAHQVTVMTVQAEGARRVADGSDPRVVEALETIRDAGHSALAEMRRTVGLLRAPEEEAETEPIPRLSDINHLVSQIRAAGVPVDLEISGNVRPLAEGTELSAYRIVQESLTNSVRHGGPDVAASVTIRYDDDRLDVRVLDDGRGAAADPGDGDGHGIVGMRERIAVLGGEFSAKPNDGGGYQVHAVIPDRS